MDAILPAAGAKQSERRMTERVLLRIPIRVEGADANGKTFAETTYTLVINRNGARIAMRHNPRQGERLIITNLRTNMQCPFRVIERAGSSLAEEPEWGVECLEPGTTFWGIHFPAQPEGPREPELVDALLQCTGCGENELAKLKLEDYRRLQERQALNRPCPRCKVIRSWKIGSVQTERPSGATAKTKASPEPRVAKRMTVKLPVRVRLENGREEVTRTENLSKTGVCFISELSVEVGDLINVTVGYAPGGNTQEARARVVWKKPMEGSNHFAYGVHIET